MVRLVGDKCYSILTDQLGTPTRMYDEEGRKIWAATLDIYGKTRTLWGGKRAVPFRYPGQYEDAEMRAYLSFYTICKHR